MNKKHTEQLDFDKQHIWHPYTSMAEPLPTFMVESAQGVEINLASGENLIDGMSSWWAVIHGYKHPALNKAIVEQSQKVAHVMFGGLTHEPAIALAKTLIDITPTGLNKVFFSDSGSVAVEVAIKMALQYFQAKAQKLYQNKTQLLTVKNGYHGDTFAAMSVCDPVNGMHQLFEASLNKHYFAPAPNLASKHDFNCSWNDAKTTAEMASLEQIFVEHHHNIAAFIIEPIVQGAGGMRIYHPNYLHACQQLCRKYEVLFIADEIATGFGRTGKLFACEWADISPDILCLGKALTGGYMTLAATLCTNDIAEVISNGEAGCFMHGPTFMANPLACAVANASLALLLADNSADHRQSNCKIGWQNGWQSNVSRIEADFFQWLAPLTKHSRVADVRILGAIGVVECNQTVNMQQIQQRFVDLGVWIRPFGKLIYLMPPYIISSEQLKKLINAIATVLNEDDCFNQ